MKNYKKLFCLFLSVVMVLGMFAGCRKEKAEETVAPTEPVVTVEPTETPTEAPTVAPTEAPTEPATEPVIVTYVISYEVNGGKMPKDFKVIYTEEEPVELPTPTKPGFEFEGWYENEDFSGDPVTTTEGATGDKTYYAKWKDTDGNASGSHSGNAHTHKYTVKETVAATCFTDGYTVYKCECGKTYKDDYVTGSHDWEDWIVVKEATSKEEGLKKRSCSICKYVESEKIAKLPEESKPTEAPTEPEHVHSYTSTVTKPTCTEKGYTTYKCACGDSYTANEVAKTGHDYKAETIAPTTSAQGYTLHTCKNCGDSYKDNYVDKLPAETEHVHSYTSTVTKPTCTEKGYTTYKCACGDSYTANEVAKTGHDYKATTVAPTTSAQGYTLHTCKNCGDSYKDNYVDKLPEETKPSVPEVTEPEEPEETEHVHNYESKVVAPTTSHRGYTLHTCTSCGHSYKDNYVDKLPETEPEDPYEPPEIDNHTHTWGAWIEHADGYKYRICSGCGNMDLAW